MTEEFCLSEKRFICDNSFQFDDSKQLVYLEKDVKEFIKRLKEEIRKDSINDTLPKGELYCKMNYTYVIMNIINKIAGEKLI